MDDGLGLMLRCLLCMITHIGILYLATHQHTTSVGLVACITTLYIFCKIRPILLLKHATTLHPYLSSKCSVSAPFPLSYAQYFI